MIGADPVHALGGAGHAAEDVAAADHQGDLRASLEAGDDIVGDTPDGIEIDAEFALAHQRLARHLEENALVGEFAHESWASRHCGRDLSGAMLNSPLNSQSK